MGYPIIDAGLLLGTRGVGMVMAMLVAGRLMTLVDPRFLLFVRALLLHRLALLHDRLHPRHRRRAPSSGPACCRASGSASCSCRSTRSRCPRCRPPCAREGTAMWTLIRNLGSSIGVSVVIANLTNKTILMHARLAESVTPFNQAMADPAAAMLDPATGYGARAAGEPHHPAGDHHRLRQRLQADDVDDPAGLSADPADPHQPARLRGPTLVSSAERLAGALCQDLRA